MWNDLPAIIGIVGFILTVLPLTASLFKRHWGSTKVASNPYTYYVLLVNLLITAALPLSLAVEFGIAKNVTIFKPLGFYLKYYPHIVVYPVLLFGFAGLFVLRAATLSWIISKRSVLVRIAIAISGACFALFYEATGGYLMLLEFNKSAQTGDEQFDSVKVRERAQALGLGEAFTVPMATQVSDALLKADGSSAIATALKEYDGWEQLDTDWKSKSRPAYLLVFWYMMFVMLMGFSLMPIGRQKSTLRSRYDALISLNLAGALIIFLMWIPFRIHYNLYTKIPLFGTGITDNCFGRLPAFNFGGLTPSDSVPLLAITLFVYFLLLRAADLSRRVSIVIVAITSVIVILASAALAILNSEVFDAIYGLDGEVKYLCFRIVVLFFILLLTYDFLASRVDDEGDESSTTM